MRDESKYRQSNTIIKRVKATLAFYTYIEIYLNIILTYYARESYLVKGEAIGKFQLRCQAGEHLFLRTSRSI